MQSIFFLSVMNGGAWGGSEELWYQTALWTARNGYTVGVSCFDWPEKQDRLQRLKEAGCTLYLLPGKSITKKQPLLGKMKLNRAVAAIPFEHYQTVIVSQGGWKDVTHEPFKKLYERLPRYILVYHNYNEHAKFSTVRARSLQQWVHKAALNLADSSRTFGTIEKNYSITVPRQTKLFNPLSFTIPANLTPYPPLLNGNYILAVFAALDIERKAQDILIQALAETSWRKENWELHLYGEGEDKELLQRLIKKTGLQSKIFLKGKAPNYQQAVGNSHIILQITHIDAMPITVMDALSMARPLVVSKIGDMPNWVQPTYNGWITNEVNIKNVADTLTQAWKERDSWEAKGKASFDLFKKSFPQDPLKEFLRTCGIID